KSMQNTPHKTKGKGYDLKIRLLIHSITVCMTALIIFLSHHDLGRWLFVASIATIAGIALWEYGELVKKKGIDPASYLGIGSVAAYIFALFLKNISSSAPSSFLSHLGSLILGLSLFSFFIYYTLRLKPPLVSIGTALLGVIYIGVPLSLFV